LPRVSIIKEQPVEVRFSKVFQVRNYEVDVRGCLCPLVLLNFMQEVAGNHARQLGVAVSDLRQQGFTWVLSRLHLQINDLPSSRDDIVIHSWPSLREGLFSCREFEIYSLGGDRLAQATSSWAVIDLATRRPLRLSELALTYPLDPQRAIADSFPTLPLMEQSLTQRQFTVLRSDLDMNCHVNNVVYAHWLLETVPQETYDDCRLASIELGFRAEAFAGEEVVAEIARQPMGEGNWFVHRIKAVTDGRELVRARTQWAPRTKV
jgi:acyl-ACP thioesterase